MPLKCVSPFFLLLFVGAFDEKVDGYAFGLAYKTPCCGKTKSFVPDVYKKTPDFIEANGFVAETHVMTTEDGYILSVHRIPRRQSELAHNEIRNSYRPAVLIQHGISGRSDNWVLGGPKSLPYLLVDAGYDVWLADTRGNHYSKRHLRMSPQDPKFWNFSFHEQGYYDLAALTNYVLSATGQSKIFYIGHSRGTTMAYVLLSMRPEFNEKFHLLLHYSPVAYVKNARSPVLRAIFKKNSQELTELARHLGLVNFPGLNEKTEQFRLNFCNDRAPTRSVCLQFIFSLAGFDYELLNNSMVTVYATHFPDGGSLKEFFHYFQIAESDKFRMYDYGPKNNIKVYGRYEPPEYCLENITAPIALFYGLNDYIVSFEDFQRLNSRLKNVVAKYQVPFKKFNHLDFLWATKADMLLYKPTIKLMNSYWKYR